MNLFGRHAVRGIRGDSSLWTSLRVVGFFTITIWSLGGGVSGVDAADRVSDDTYYDLWQRGEYGKALELLEPLVESMSGSPPLRYLLHRSELRFANGRVDEAIEDMDSLAKRYPEPLYTLKLALMYQYRGKPLNFEQHLRRAYARAQNGRWRWSQRREENLVAIPRIHELLGENPKTILSAVYGQIFEHYPDLAAAHVGAGDIAYRSSGYDVAARYYTQALKIEADNQDALAGLTECYRKSGDARVESTLEALLELNPNHPRARRIRVEQLLDLGRSSEALELIEEGLEINEWDLHLLSLKSAAHFLQDDRRAMRATWDKTLEFNPVWSELYRTTGRVASRHYRFEEGAGFQSLALELDPQDYQARAAYTLDLMRLGRETEGRDELEKAFEADRFNVQLFNLLQLMDTLETFAEIESGDFLLKMPEVEAPVLAEDALDLLESALARYEKKYHVKLEKPVLVEMFDQHDDFMVRSVGLPGSVGHLGICFGKVVTMDTPSVRSKGSSNWRSVLLHEFVHVITLQKTKNRMPRWLSEGISVYEEGQYSPAWHSKLDPDYLKIVSQEDLPRVGDIAAFFTRPKTSGHLLFGYFVAGEFVQFYVDTYGFKALVDSLDGIRRGKATVEALGNAADVSLKDLDKSFLIHLDARFQPFDNLADSSKAETGLMEMLKNFLDTSEDQDTSGALQAVGGGAERFKPPFNAAMERAAEAVEAEDWESAEAALKEAHSLFPEYSGRDAPLRQLAQLYMRLDRREEFKNTLVKIGNWTPTELEASLRLVEIYREEENWAEAIRMGNEALGIDPYDVATRRSMVEMLRASGAEDTDLLLRQIETLIHLDPSRASDYRLEKSRLLTEKDDWDGAKSELVRLLEEVPHFWEAQDLLLDVVDRGGDVEDSGDTS